MTEEEYFRKNYPDSCYGDKPLSPHWDFFQDGVEFGERQSEKRIDELKKENTELKERLKPENCLKLLAKEGYVKFTSEQLIKAKELLKKVVGSFYYLCEINNFSTNYECLAEAEQFLNSEVEK